MLPRPTERLRFREMTDDDLDVMAALLGDPAVMTFYPAPKTRAEAAGWIAWNRRNYAEHGYGLWVIETLDGEFLGDCGLTWQQVGGERRLEVGYHVRADRQGQGFASEAAAACRDLARDVLHADELVAIVHPDNVASRRVAEKLGMRHVADDDTAAGPRVVLGTDLGVLRGNVSTVVRVGGTVRRPAGPWTPTVQALLAWVRAHGVTSVPAPHGLDDLGREVLGWMDGETAGWPVPGWVWESATTTSAGRLLRAWHDASRGFDLAGATWRSPVHEPVEVVCLNDVAPYNMVHDGERLVGFIDVDMASPGPRVWDLSYLAYRLCGWCEDMPAPDDGPAPAARLDLLLDAYGRDAAPSAATVMTTMRRRLLELAAWTDDHARATDRPELHDHAAMYRRDAARL